MIGVHSAAEMRAVEEAFFAAHPDVNLMRRAAKAVSDRAEQIAPEGFILVVAGSGNNGGDGLHAAANLATASRRPVAVWLVDGKGIPSGVIAARQAGVRFIGASAAIRMLSDAALVIDAVYGTGGRPGLPDVVGRFADACRDVGIPVLSIDIPSGLSCDSPTVPESRFQASWTTTFQVPKLCLVAQPASDYAGCVEIVDIGLEMPDPRVRLLEKVDVAKWWPWPSNLDDKYSRGVLGIDTGSDRYLGAAMLSTMGALYSGSAMLRFVGPEKARDAILYRLPSVTFGDGPVQAWLCGCGWGAQDEDRMRAVLNAGKPAVIDAEAIDTLPKELPSDWLLTPHAGELARMMEIDRAEVIADPLGRVREAAMRWHTTILLKGATQYVAEPDGRVTIAIGGPAWSAQAGSGDVLSGICGTLLAAGLPAWKAGVLGASIQAMAAQSKMGPYPPGVIATEIPKVLAELDAARPTLL